MWANTDFYLGVRQMASKSFSIVFDASMNISQMTSAVKKIQAEFNKLQLGGSFQKNFTSLLTELDSAIKNFEAKTGRQITSKKDITEIENATRRIVNLYERLKIEAKTLSGISNKELQKLFPEDLEKDFKQAKSYLKEYERAVEKNNKEIEEKQKQQKQAQEKLSKAQQKDAAKGRQRISASEMRDLKNSQTQLNKQRKKQQEAIAQLEEERDKRITSGDMRIKKDGNADKRYGDAASNQKLLDDLQKARTELENLSRQYNQVSDKINSSITEADYSRNLENIQKEIKEAQNAVTKFEQEISDLKASPQATESFENLRKEVEKLTDLDLSNIAQDLDGFERLKQVFNEFQSGKIDELRGKLEQLENATRGFGDAAEDTREAVREQGNAFAEISREAQDLARLQDQVLDFFSLSNTIQIFKNAIRDAFETVKELDAVMTETAVVTDFSIGDMWDKLPEYSEEANKLGTSIKSLYEATTLYYQQGLNSDQAMNVGIETMKMARIANMDAAAATEAMTAALRGFNMEINETNATRINDVYSELAAITAADTEQIATAMSKTASIADAANMEFETTAAFLAQIIETTQEAPETAGTAMKTIIARFTEVKELFDEGMLSGKDAEGEEININKIDAALKKVGISLNDFLRGEKGIDDIFLELASKWDTLDLATQRYIATTAAGSRQQSRFLAMMSNYDRTMELVTAANNSAGASQKQFDKTLESLEAKLQRLNNAWQEFTMGLANNEVIKAGVDLLTWLLETINKITGVAGNEGLGGVVTMFARLVTVIGALKGGGAIIKNLISGMAKTGVFSKNTLGIMGLDETGNWIKDISLMKILMNTLNITTEKSHILFGKLGIAITKAATGFKLAGAEGAVAGASVTIGWLPVVGIIAGIIVVVWALVAAFKAAYAASPEGKLEAASAAADSAAEAAEGAAQAYEHLAAALDSIDGKSSALENLAVGTTEWKNAVQELNGEILDLVEQYPELAQFISSSDGYLKLDTKGYRNIGGEQKTVKDILSDYQENKFKAQSASAAAKLYKQQAQNDLNYSKLDSNIKIAPKIDIPEYNPQYYSTQISQLRGGPYSAERAQKIATIQEEWSEAEIEYNEAVIREANAQFLPETRELTEKVAKAIASNQIEGISIDKKTKNKTITVDGESYTFDYNSYEQLEKYGEGLIAADAATKVFTDSLMSNAMMISDVSEDQKSNMMNFLDSEQVKSQVDAMLETINQNWTNPEARKQYKKDYAEIMGYEYDEGKDRFLKDEQEVQVSDESIRKQIAGVEVQDNLTERMKALNIALTSFEQTTKNANKTQENYYKQEEGLKDAFIQLTSDAEGAGLTFKAIDQLSGRITLNKDGTYIEDENEYFTKLFNENEKLQEAYGGDIQEFLSFIYKNLNLAEERKEKTTKKAAQMRASNEDYLAIETADLSSGIISNIIDGLYDVALASGNEKARELDSELSNMMAKLEKSDPEAAQKFAQAIGDLNWRDINDVENLSNDLEDLGIASLFSEGQIDELEQKIISLAKAARAFNADKLKEAFGKSRNLAEEVRGREDGERTFTEEQMKQLIESGGAKAEDFVWTGEDEFTYIGASMDTLAAALDRNTAAQLEEYKQGLQAKAEAAQKWEESQLKYGEGADFYENIFAAAAAGNLEVSVDKTTMTDKSTGREYAATGYNLETYRQAAIGYGMADMEAVATMGIEQLIALFANYYDLVGTATKREQAKSENERFLAQYGPTSAYLQSPSQIYSGMTQGVITSQDAGDALDAQMVNQNVAQEDAAVLTDALLREDEAFTNATEAGKAHALQLEQIKQKNAQAAESVNKYLEEYTKFKGVGKQADAALLKTAKALKTAFGVEPDTDWIKRNEEDIKAWANGSEEAGKRVAESLKKEYADKMIDNLKDVGVAMEKGATASVEEYAAAILSLPSDLQVSADFDGTALSNGIVASEAQLAAFSAAIAAMTGLSIAWTRTEAGTADDGTPLYNWYMNSSVGNGSGYTGGGGGGDGGGGGGSEWENPYDKLYNVQENIDRTIREREQIERRYQRLLDRRLATAQELYKTSQAEIDALREQAEYQQKMVAGRQEMLQKQMDENEDLQKYATVNVETGQITIDWELINSVTDEDKGKKIEEYISKLEELRDSMHEAQDAIEEIDDSIWEIEERGREEYMEFEDRVKEALVEVFQKEIDSLEEINNSINETNEKLIDSIQNSIDKIRQDRENEKTEEELGEKQRRLAYLEQDTSGANALEILELQEEIRQGQEDYTDSLIDQKISELQEQNDKAAEQREQQITLMQNQLDWQVESGRIWAEVDELLRDGLSPQGGLIRGSKLEEIMKDGENWTGLSKIGQMDWLLDLETMIAQSSEWRMKGGQLENLENKLTGQEITFRNAKGEVISGKVDEKGQVVLDDGSYYKDVYQWIDGTYHTTESEAIRPTPPPLKPTTVTSQASQNTSGGQGEYNEKDSVYYHSAPYRYYYYNSATNGISSRILSITGSGKTRDEAKAQAEKEARKLEKESWLEASYQAKYGKTSSSGGSRGSGGDPRKNTKFQKFATGGLANFTGPAWLDGTKSRPELVLNQRDTQNFIQLKDILSSIMSRNIPTTHTSTENNGDLSFDIDINVESLQSDYDVEQVASKVKSMIVDNARYRNNNTISLTR